MEPTVKEVVEERPTFAERTPTLADVEALQRQRIRFDGFFTGPTW
jgi:hypothetical protein